METKPPADFDAAIARLYGLDRWVNRNAETFAEQLGLEDYWAKAALNAAAIWAHNVLEVLYRPETGPESMNYLRQLKNEAMNSCESLQGFDKTYPQEFVVMINDAIAEAFCELCGDSELAREIAYGEKY